MSPMALISRKNITSLCWLTVPPGALLSSFRPKGGMDIETVAHDTPELITTSASIPRRDSNRNHGRAVAFGN